MNELTIFEQNGKLFTDSREVAVAVEKEHSKLLRDIRGYCKYLTESNFGLSDYFVESSYQDSTGRTLPCFQCTKKGCDMIANKMTGRKGVVFTAKYITAFEKMKDFISQGLTYTGIPLKDQIESLEAVAEMLHMNEASKIGMVESLYRSYNIPTDFLPKYEHNGGHQLKAATALLKENGCALTAQRFNALLVEHGYLEERQRESSKGGFKKFKALTDKGTEYGENVVSPHNQREVQPLYYADKFEELYNTVMV